MTRAAAPEAPPVDRLQEDFERAAEADGGPVELRLAVAGKPVCIRFAGRRPADALTAAFAHLQDPNDAPPELTLHVWDARRRGPAANAAGASYYYERDGVRALHQPASDVLSVLDADADTGWFRMPDANGLPYWEYTAPFRHLLSWWLDAHGLRQVHGGAVGTDEAGVLLVGAGGSGKSTTALSCLLDERLRYAGDDYVAVGSGRAPAVHSLYCSGKVHRKDLHRLPHLEPVLADGLRPDEKAVFYIERAFPGRSIAGFPLRAVVVPRVTDRTRARAIPGTRAEALAALAPSTIFQLHPPARDALAWMAEFVRAVPTFILELGSDVESIPVELLRIIEQ